MEYNNYKPIIHEIFIKLDRELKSKSLFDLLDEVELLYEKCQSTKDFKFYLKGYLVFIVIITTFIVVNFQGFDKFIETNEQDFIIYLNLYDFYNIDQIFKNGHYQINSKDLRNYVRRYLVEHNQLSFNIEELYHWLNEYIIYLKEKDKEEDLVEFESRYPVINGTVPEKAPYPTTPLERAPYPVENSSKIAHLPSKLPEKQSNSIPITAPLTAPLTAPITAPITAPYTIPTNGFHKSTFNSDSHLPPSNFQKQSNYTLQHSNLHYNVPLHVLAQQQQIKSTKIHISKEYAICGLVNFGSSCYINSSIQLLFGIRAFKMIFQKHGNGLLSDAFAGLIQTFERNGGRSISPTKFLKVCGSLKSDFNIPHEQQDAQEYLLFILDRLNEEMNSKKTIDIDNYISKWKININIKEQDQYKKWIGLLLEQGTSPIKDLFEGHIKNTLQCQRCFYESINFNQFNILSLPAQRNSNLSDVLSQFIKDEVLDSWTCPKCNGDIPTIESTGVFETKKSLFKKKKKVKKEISQSTSIKSTQFIKLPNILLIHITKLNLDVFIDYPLTLSFNNNGHKIVYHLRGFINHYGTLKSGHYTALVNKSPDNKFWCLFDDENVRQNIQVGFNELNSKDIFVLCYERYI
ncbi:unnamed protein product [Candida verbasci]|uniref:Ubiquitin carboxyl-terminal hydrolase n=1 Tax=Candida verbasci TaxID=1227364 RepID=A0A9W4TWS3_9ASCO|nr:unnamed protein product [Candida verbasci]